MGKTYNHNFRMTEKETGRMGLAMMTIGMENTSEFIRDAIRHRCEQIEDQKTKEKENVLIGLGKVNEKGQFTMSPCNTPHETGEYAIIATKRRT
jgi:metal-responsive CopG/Arc/MetJ family transcriptional regulator